jgi:hypothetical protein
MESSVLRVTGRLFCLAILAILAIGARTGARAQQPSIVGTWEWTRKSNNCSERYVFRDDGNLSIRRGENLTENTYLMSWAPEPGGRYRVTVVTVADDRGRVCEGSTEDTTGRRSVVYVLFGQSRETMIQCGSPSGADCTGLMHRTGR